MQDRYHSVKVMFLEWFEDSIFGGTPSDPYLNSTTVLFDAKKFDT